MSPIDCSSVIWSLCNVMVDQAARLTRDTSLCNFALSHSSSEQRTGSSCSVPDDMSAIDFEIWSTTIWFSISANCELAAAIKKSPAMTERRFPSSISCFSSTVLALDTIKSFLILILLSYAEGSSIQPWISKAIKSSSANLASWTCLK